MFTVLKWHSETGLVAADINNVINTDVTSDIQSWYKITCSRFALANNVEKLYKINGSSDIVVDGIIIFK